MKGAKKVKKGDPNKTNMGPAGNPKPVKTGKGTNKKAAAQPPGKRTMFGGKNRVEKMEKADPAV